MRQTNCCCLVALLIVVVGGHIEMAAASELDDQIIAFLEALRVRMCHPLPKYGIPALDPLEIKNLQVKADNKYLINFNGSVTDFRLTGLSDFIINQISIKRTPISKSIINVTMPLTAFKSDYTALGSLAYILNLNGTGDAYAEWQHLNVFMSWNLKASTTLGIRNFLLKIKIGSIFIDFENLFEEERITDFFHALVNELGLELINDVWELKNDSVQKTLENIINSYIGNYSLADIIQIIAGGGGSGNPIFGDIPADCKDNLV